MKRMLTLVLVLAMLLSTAVVPAMAEEPVKLTMWIFLEQFVDYYNEMNRRWNEQEGVTPVELDIQVFPSADYNTKLISALQSGTAPDIVDVEISSYGLYTRGDDVPFLELNDVIEAAGPENFVMSRFENYSKDGKYYGIDCHIGATIAFYNDELLSSAGINYKDIKTWEDWRQAGITLKEKTGKVMTTYETSDVWSVYPLISQVGGDYLTKDSEVILDSQSNIDILKWHQENLFDLGIAEVAPGGNHHAEEYWSWMNAGNAGCVIMPFWYVTRFVQYMPDLKGKIKVAPMPIWEDRECYTSAQMGGTGTSVVKASPNAELAKEWLAFAKLTYDACIQSWKLLGNDPIRKDVYDDPAMAEPNEYFDYYGNDMLDVVKEVTQELPNTNITEWFVSASSIVGSQLSYEIFGNGTPVEDACHAAAEELRSEIAAG